MTGTETVAERLRNAEGLCEAQGLCGILLYVVKGEKHCPPTESCAECKKDIIKTLASKIKAEQAEPQLPEGIEWPRFEDGELVKFGDKFDHVEGYRNIPVERITFRADGWVDVSQRGGIYQPLRPGERLKRPEPEVLDADGVPIKVGDTVWDSSGESHEVVEINVVDDDEQLIWCGRYLHGMKIFHIANEVTHRKPDTAESLLWEFIDAASSDDGPDLTPIIERSLKLLGGE